MPKNYQYYVETWRRYHPNWKIKIWYEADLIKENFPSMDLYLLAESYAERADIMRYEIIKRYGGLYVDADTECFASFDELHHKYDFYANLDPIALRKAFAEKPYAEINIINSMIGAVANHPIIAETLINIRNNWSKAKNEFETVNTIDPSIGVRSKHWLAIERTMYPLTIAVFQFLEHIDQSKYKSIILPISYNVPVYFLDNNRANFLRELFFLQPEFGLQTIIKPETISYHHVFKKNSLISKVNLVQDFFIKDKYYLNFSNLYEKNFPTNIQYETKPKIAEIIYINNNNDLSIDALSTLKEQWQKMNHFAQIKIIDDLYLEQFLPKSYMSLDKKIQRQLLSFYLLSHSGGIYVDSDFIPTKLQELNFKYSYYGLFANKTTSNKSIELDRRFIASRTNHSIIRHLIKDIEEHILKHGHITESDIDYLYRENVYQYNQLDGKSMIFLEQVFQSMR